MLLDKLKKMFPKKETKGNKGKRKLENMVVFVVILIFTIVAINYIWSGGENKKENNTMPSQQNTSEVKQVSSEIKQDDVEKKLENILSKMQGVGKVSVMLTYAETSTYIPIYNENTKGSNTTETDSTGGSRTISEEDSQKEVIYKEDSSGNKEPVTQSIISPKIEGAIITAEGAGSANVKANIVAAVEAATGLATHKIQVFKMEN